MSVMGLLGPGLLSMCLLPHPTHTPVAMLTTVLVPGQAGGCLNPSSPSIQSTDINEIRNVPGTLDQQLLIYKLGTTTLQDCGERGHVRKTKLSPRNAGHSPPASA